MLLSSSEGGSKLDLSYFDNYNIGYTIYNNALASAYWYWS